MNTNRKDPGKRKIRDAGKKRVTTQRGDTGGTQRPRAETVLQRVLGGRRGFLFCERRGQRRRGRGGSGGRKMCKFESDGFYASIL